MNAFNLFKLSPCPILDLDALRERYQELAADAHPDSGGSQQQFDELNQAYTTLRTHSKRLNLLMEVECIEFDPRGAISSDLMDSFMSTGSLQQKAEQLARKKSQASSAIAKALLEGEVLQTQEELSEQIDTLNGQLNDQLTTLQELDLNVANQQETLKTAARNLSFLEKWIAQLKASYASLF